MTTKSRKRASSLSHRVLSLAALALLALSGCSIGVQGGAKEKATNFPNKTIALTIPYSPGGGSDLIGRTLASNIEEPLGESVVVMNREGASGRVGNSHVANSNPDGYSIGITNSSIFSVTPLFQPTDAQSLDDFQVLRALSFEPIVLFASAKSEYQDLGDVLALKDSGKDVKYAHSGPGGTTLVAESLFFGKAGVSATGVPFSGGPEIITAVMGGHVDFGAGQVSEVMEQVKAGSLRILGVFAKDRVKFIPDVPTAAEMGVDVDVAQSRLLVAPKGVDRETLDILSKAADEAIGSDAYQTFLTSNYISTSGLAGDAIVKSIAEDKAKYSAGFDSIGLDPQKLK